MDLKTLSYTVENGSGADVEICTLDENEDFHCKDHAFTTVKEALEFLKSLVEEEMKKHG